MRFLISLLTVLLLFAPAQAQVMIPSSDAQIKLSFAPLVKAASPAVVNIFAERVVAETVSPFRGSPMFADMFRNFGETRPRVQNSLGSGVILSEDGIVVSNYHVVGMATDIRVVLTDRREFKARILMADQDTDLAILKIESDASLPWLAFRDSDAVEVGELVLAIGNPFGIGQTVSSGIVSGLARSGVATGNARGYFIQTDAPINPGNSGGALIDMAGQLVGINTRILTHSGGSNGVGFAIPSNLVGNFVAQARAGNQAFARPWAGITALAVDVDLAEGFGLDAPEGVVISQMHPESPFAKAGLVVGDIVTEVDGLPVNTPAEMLFRMSTKPLGTSIEVTFLSKNGQNSAMVPLMQAPKVEVPEVLTVEVGNLKGLEVVTLNARLQSKLGLPVGSKGVVITTVPPQLVQVGLAPGDIIREVNGNPIRTSADVIQESAENTRSWQVIAERGARTFTFRFSM